MKRELALRLLQTILPDLDDEGTAANLFRELQFIAEYKYNKYEMYHPGRLFLENLYLWLQQFEKDERIAAIEFVRKNLIFVSRQEFQQLAGVLYHDIIKQQQIKVAARLGGFPPHKIRAIRESSDFKKVARASLYVGMSDGARIDHLRRQNLEISNEQVLPYYETSSSKIDDLLAELHKASSETGKFCCLFLLDDFCGSGMTLLREVVAADLRPGYEAPIIPPDWKSRLRCNQDSDRLELVYGSRLSSIEKEQLRKMGHSDPFIATVEDLIQKYDNHQVELRGSLKKVSSGQLSKILNQDAEIYFCPLLATEHALDRVRPLLSNLPGPFSTMKILPAAIISSKASICNDGSPISNLCEKYYDDDFADHHTGCVKYGYDGCGLPLVLHHNTPNNSIFLLWARRKIDFDPLFVRYERHGREGA